MNYTKRLIFLTFFVPFFSVAQNYQPGVIVNLKGDTLHGFIRYKKWEDAPKNIFFKTDSNKAPVKFSVNDIKYFNASVGYLEEFQRYEGPVTTDNTDVDHLYTGKDTSFRIDTVFLKIIQKGKNLILFSYTDNIKTRYFISQNIGDEPKELIYRVYYNNADENSIHKTSYDRTYAKQLEAIAEKLNNPDLMERIFKTDYTETDLLNIAGRINGISDKNLSKSPQIHHKPWTLIILASIFLTLYFSHILKGTY